ncbi:unnamed protein product [Heterobilharzia americana]|nr:unnamed protein product [Heterobilharzia americana]
MELASIRNQLVLLFNNLKNIQPSERDSLITYMKTTLSQIQESGGEDKCHNNSNDNYDYSSSSSSNSSSSKSDVINTSSITNSSSTNQMVKKSPNLSNLTSPNLNYLQLTETTSETVAVDEVTDFTTLATTVNHDTSIDGHDFSEVIDVDEFLSITDPPAFNCCDSSNELNLGETFQENSILVDNNSSNNFKQLTTVSQYQLCNDETFLNCPLSHECFDWGRLHLPCRVFINNSLKSFNTFSKIELQRKQYPIDGVFLSRRCGLCYKSSVIFTSYEEFEKHKSSSHSVHGIDSGFEPPQPSKHLRPSVCSITRKKKRSLKRNTPSSIHPCSDAAVRSVVRNLTERFYMLKNQRVGEKRRQRRRKSTVGNTSDDFIENYTSDGDMISDIHQSEAMLEVPITTRCIDNITTTNPTTASGITDASVSPTTMTSSISSHEQSSKSTDYCPSTFLTSLLAAQRAKRNLTLKNKRSRQHRDVSFDSDVTDQLIAGEEVDLNASKTKTTSFPCDIPPSPSIGSYISERENGSVHSRTNSWLLRQRKRILPSTRSSSRHLKLQFRRKSAIGFRKMKNTMSSTCDYRVNPIKIRRFICHCCSAVFRLSSRLRAHYLFQHGHIPESLGGLSPRPNEAVPNCEWSQSVNNDDNDLNTDNNFDINNVSDIDNQSESICTTVYNELCTQYTGKINSTLETVGTQLVSSDAHNKLESISLGMNTRMRKRKAVSSNNATSVTSTTTASTASLTRNSRRAKKQASEMISAMTNHISSIRDHNSRSKSSSKRRTTDSLSEHLTTEEIDQLLPDSNLLLKRYYCRECNATFKSAYNVKRHEGIVHRREYRYFCGYCEFRTGERLAYEEHLARHFSVKQFVCETCNARFTIKHELDDHIAFKHSNERNFACSECDQRFKTSGTLWRHKKIHEKRVYHICSICSTSFTSQSTGNESLVGNSNRPTNRRTTTKLTVNNDGSESSRNCQPSKKNFMPSSNDNTCGVDEDSNLKTPLNSFDVQCQQTIGDVIPLEIITPQISGGNCSSNRQTVINILSDHHPGFSQLISIADGNLDEGVSVNQSMSSSCSHHHHHHH